MLAATLQALRLVRIFVPAVAFSMPALASVGTLMLDVIVWSWSVTVLLDLLLLLIWNIQAGVVCVIILTAHLADDVGLG